MRLVPIFFRTWIGPGPVNIMHFALPKPCTYHITYMKPRASNHEEEPSTGLAYAKNTIKNMLKLNIP
jgi:hypothetical protein